VRAVTLLEVAAESALIELPPPKAAPHAVQRCANRAAGNAFNTPA
jgi:hypothetical protein